MLQVSVKADGWEKIMDLNKGNLKKIRGLILFTAVVCLAVLNMDVVLHSFFWEL